MDRYRLSLIIIGVLAVAILGGGWALGIQPQLDRMNTAAKQTAAITQLNTVQEAKNAALAADSKKMDEFAAQLAADQAQIPQARAQQDLVDQFDAAAASSGVVIESLVFDPAVAYVPPAGVAVPTPAGETLVAVPTTITASGPRANLEAFAAAVQASTRIVSIASSQYIGPDDSAVTLVGTTWVLQAPATAAPTTTEPAS